ncbi:hypothetical protein, partial [Legionella micdadei]|uniref:hypothetical protein n=1 Tax=Legionella micdadei TaxID=451 RepID=UPI001C2CEE5B
APTQFVFENKKRRRRIRMRGLRPKHCQGREQRILHWVQCGREAEARISAGIYSLIEMSTRRSIRSVCDRGKACR